MRALFFPLLIDLQDISTKANRGGTYPYLFGDCLCCNNPISVNFVKQSGNCVFCDRCLRVEGECCKRYNK